MDAGVIVDLEDGVAGVSAPAFVERAMRARAGFDTPCVAGVSAPAFVERIPNTLHRRCLSQCAGVSAPAFVERAKPRWRSRRAWTCRRGLGPGLR